MSKNEIDVEDQSNSHNLLGYTNAGDVGDGNNSTKPTPGDSQQPPPSTSMIAFATLLLILLMPIIIASAIYSCFKGTSKDGGKKNFFEAVKDDKKDIYARLSGFELEPVKDKLRRLIVVAADKLGYVASLWLVLNLCVPSFKEMTLFGSPLWKWSLSAVIILLGHLCSRIITRVIVAPTIRFLNTSRREKIELFTVGLQDSFSTLVYFSLILTIWRVYFHGDDGLNPNPSVDKYGTWTLVSLLVGAALRVLKRAALLNWEANAIYERFKDRILFAGLHLFFVSIILDNVQQDSLKLKHGPSFKELVEIKDGKMKIREDVTLVQVQEAAARLTSLVKQMSREDDETEIRKCEDKIKEESGCWEDIKQGSYDSFAHILSITRDNAEDLLKAVQAKYPNKETITREMVRRWMVDAHKNCLLVGYTLTDALAVVSVLDAVLTCFIVIVVILFWLLVTGLAQTRALVTIGTIFVALSFMFGDTCKAFFQGVVFSFVLHPFDIGDRCIIDGVEVEVKRIGILMTTCIKIGTGEKMLYPSSDLSNKLIINLESKPDPTDLIEMVLDTSTKTNQIERVRESIKEFINGTSCYEKDHQVTVKGKENSMMMSVRFKHILNAEGMTHSECFATKDSQKCQLFIKIKRFFEDQHIESKE